MTAWLQLLGRALDRLMGGRPVDMAGRLAPYADPFHLDSRPGGVTPVAARSGPARPGVYPPGARPSRRFP